MTPDRAGRFSARVTVLFGTQIVSTSLGIFNGILLAKLLGPELKGDYYLVVLLPATIMVALQLGLPPAIGYYTARGQVRRLITKVLSLVVVLSLIAIVLSLTVLPSLEEAVLRGPSHEQITAGLLAIPILLTSSFMTSIVIGRQAVGWNLFANILSDIASTVAMVLFVGILGLGIWGGITAYLISGAALAVGFLIGARQVVAGVSGPTDVSFRQLFRYALPYYPGSLTSFFSYRFDVYLLAWLLADPSAPLGYYSMAVSLASMVFFLPDAVASLFFPHVAGSDRADADRQVSRVSRVTLVVSAAAGLSMVPASYVLIHVVLPAFEPALGALVILLPGVVALSVSNVLMGYVTGLGRPGVTSIINIGALAINVAVNLVLIPQFGILGASAASLVSYTATSLAYTVIASRMSATPFLRFWIPGLSDVRFLIEMGSSMIRRVLRRPRRDVATSPRPRDPSTG